jgi:hypothetical protein
VRVRNADRATNAHGSDPEVGERAGDALPAARVGVGRPPGGEPLGGGVEGQLELQQRLACIASPSLSYCTVLYLVSNGSGRTGPSVPSRVRAKDAVEQRRAAMATTAAHRIGSGPSFISFLCLVVGSDCLGVRPVFESCSCLLQAVQWWCAREESSEL